MEHLGDAVGDRYLLVAPSRPLASRRQYHAVDLSRDRMVAVRFEPRDTHDGRGHDAAHTADGHTVLDDGSFDGCAYVVIDGSFGPSAAELADLEARIAAPCAPEPRPRRRPVRAIGRFRPGAARPGRRPPASAGAVRPGPRAAGAGLRRRLAVAGAAMVVVAISVTTLLAGAQHAPRPPQPTASPAQQQAWVSTAR